jgi:caffeoyl-CoA O-methyltransferase
MFHNIPETIKERMAFLENLDGKHRRENAPSHIRLKQVPRETGKFLALFASLAPKGTWLEIGTSAGYSGLWLSLACRNLGNKLITFEVLENKFKLAEETFRVAGVTHLVQQVFGDARDYLDRYRNIGFCFLDAEKEIYLECYDKIIPNMMKGGILIADNVISHKDILDTMVKNATQDARVDAMVVPVGRGELVCVRR